MCLATNKPCACKKLHLSPPHTHKPPLRPLGKTKKPVLSVVSVPSRASVACSAVTPAIAAVTLLLCPALRQVGVLFAAVSTAVSTLLRLWPCPAPVASAVRCPAAWPAHITNRCIVAPATRHPTAVRLRIVGAASASTASCAVAPTGANVVGSGVPSSSAIASPAACSGAASRVVVVRCHMLALMLAVVPVVTGRARQMVRAAAHTRSPACAGPC
jgi:hypothetical protein